ncbi:MAG TPA: LacI family DNA-binding transcriptional regulator [Trebonia sp.]
MSNQRPTMKDVARRAGVALKTVSRVVNGEAGVTAATAGRVQGAIEELGFRRNESARLLRTGRTATLGFIAEDTADPDQAAVYRGLEEAVAELGFLLYSGSTDGDPAREERLALALCARRVDGMVIVPAAADHRYLVAEIEAGVAAVFALRPPAVTGPETALGYGTLGGNVLGGTVLGDTVVIDERGGANAAVKHLIAHGHSRIGYLGGHPSAPGAPGGYRSRQLLLGYSEAMAAAGLRMEQAWTALTPGQLAGAGVTAVLCGSRAHTAQALHALAGRGRAPRMAVIGFGDFELADLMPTGITVISYDPAGIGRAAGELLARRLAGDDAPPRLVELPVRLIPRGSAEFPPEE